jgi:hypothetical protein
VLKNRIGKLEALVARLTARYMVETQLPSAADLEHFRSDMNIICYRHWRYEGLSLEELFAIARDDVAHANENPHPTWSPGYREIEKGRWVAFGPQVAAREFAVRLLERDSLVDTTVAKRLRDNLQEFAASKESLSDLPIVPTFDEQSTLKVAREKCPRRDLLPLSVQLEMVSVAPKITAAAHGCGRMVYATS